MANRVDATVWQRVRDYLAAMDDEAGRHPGADRPGGGGGGGGGGRHTHPPPPPGEENTATR
jgi:hypothetical protein